MGQEIERKFLVPVVPDVVSGPGAELRQGYLAVDGDIEVRVRVEDGVGHLTVKAGSGLVRTEVDLPLADDDIAALWRHTEGRQVEKARHRVILADGLVAEVDVYEGALAGLCTCEVEFPDEGTAAAFVAPPWCGRELTGEPGWSNARLAADGRPASAAPP